MTKAPALLGSSGDSLREACGKELTRIAPDYPNVVVLDADIAGGTGMHHFRKAYPKRFIQCGIAEQNMMAMAGGLAATGLIPVVTTFAVFLLRSIEQARLSISYANMNVKIIASHPGLDVGPDGGSAQSLEEDLDTLEKALECRQSDIVKAQESGREYFMKLLGDLQEAQKDSEPIKNALVKIKQYSD